MFVGSTLIVEIKMLHITHHTKTLIFLSRLNIYTHSSQDKHTQSAKIYVQHAE